MDDTKHTQEYDWEYFSRDPKIIEQQLRSMEGFKRGKFKFSVSMIDLGYLLGMITNAVFLAIIFLGSTFAFSLFDAAWSSGHIAILCLLGAIPAIIFIASVVGTVHDAKQEKQDYHTKLAYAKHNGWR